MTVCIFSASLGLLYFSFGTTDSYLWLNITFSLAFVGKVFLPLLVLCFVIYIISG